MSTTYKNIVATVLGLALVFALAFSLVGKAQAASLSQSQVDAIINLLVSFGADQATIDNVRSALTGQPSNNNGGGNTNQGGNTGSCTPMVFTMNHKMGDMGGEVMNIQKFLNANGFTVAVAGPGSPGNETSYFGPATKAAAIKFQNAYASEILAPVGLSVGTGYWGSSTRAKANAMEQARCAAQNQNNNGGDDNQDNNQATDELTVSAAAQPANSLAPAGATNVPFTRFTLTAGSSDVKVDEVTVELQGLANRLALRNVAIIDEDGTLVTRRKSLDSDRKAKFTKDFTVPANTSKTYTIVANVRNVATYAGQVATLALVDIKADKDVNGTLPISGASHTINTTLAIGQLDYDYRLGDQNVDVGDDDEKIAEIKFTAQNEDLLIKKVVFEDATGDADANTADWQEAFTNVKAEYNDNDYPVEITQDDEMVVDFGAGVTLEDGDSETLTIKADIKGESGKVAVLALDEDNTKAMGKSYGYGAAFNPTDMAPLADDYAEITIGGSDITADDDSSFSSSNKATPGDTGVTLAMWEITNATGDDVNVDTFDVSVTPTYTSGTDADHELHNVALYQDGTKIADFGNVTMGASGTAVSVEFTDVTLAPGTDVKYSLKADIDSDAKNDSSYEVDITAISGAETTDGDNVSADVSDVAAQTTTITTGDFEVELTTDDVNDPKAVLDNVQDVVLAQYEFKADDAEIEVDGFKATINGDDNIDGKVEVWVDGHNVAEEDAAASVDYDNLNITIAKDSKVTVELRADMKDGGTGSVQVTALNDFTFDTDPATFNGGAYPTNDDFTTAGPAITVAAALPEVTVVDTPTITMTQSSMADKEVLEFKVKALEDDVTLQDITISIDGDLNGGGSGLGFTNAELKIYSDSAHQDEVATVDWGTSGVPTDSETITIPAADQTISEGDTYYFVLEADLNGTSGGYAYVKLEDSSAAMTFTTPAVSAELVIPDEFKSTVNTNL